MSEPLSAQPTCGIAQMLLAEILTIGEYGCSDRYCKIATGPRGMCTNGGCKCIHNLHEFSERLRLLIEREGGAA